jgi:hypothetical protein
MHAKCVHSRSKFVVDTDRRSPSDRADVVRFVIDLLTPDAVKYECDVPLSQQATWPAAVREAASVLSSLRPPKKRDGTAYRQTGVQERGDDAVWDAFIIFAAYAYDASVWNASGRDLVHLADEGTSFVARLTDEEADLIRTKHDVSVVPLKEWRRATR